MSAVVGLVIAGLLVYLAIAAVAILLAYAFAYSDWQF
jgi:hypothetical protein